MRRMRQRALSLLILLTMLALLPGTAWAAETSGSCGANVTWSYNDGTLTIQGTGTMDTYYNAEDCFTRPWYDFYEQIHTATIGDGVTSIGGGSFYYCEDLTSVTIPGSITSIEGVAFYYCSKLTSIYIPAGVTYIGWSAFAGCENLKDVYYGGSESQ